MKNSLKEDLNVLDMMLFIFSRIKELFVVIIITTLLTISFYIFFTNEQYTATSVIQKTSYSPNNQNGTSSISSLGKIAGLSMGNLDVNNEKVIVKRIQTREFFDNLMGIYEEYPSVIFAAESYEKDSNKILFKSNIFDSNKKKWLKRINNQDIHEEFLDNLSVKFNLDDNLIYMSYEHPSPYFASEIILSITNLYNDEYMNKSLKESNEAIDLLMVELANSVDPVIKTNIASLIQNHYQQKMFASIKPALSFIEPPFVPDNKSSPGFVFYTILGFLLGVVIGCVYILFFNNKKI
jgi:uncharacterized protein involved in exopolysaccharide biosynthesis